MEKSSNLLIGSFIYLGKANLVQMISLYGWLWMPATIKSQQ